ncbi:hypothetical protein HKB01_03040 [Vibrio parahaemolyticus]|nr:hypothetical protein [Vibrio parahaemolyticus]NMR96251.1 hypothetical protein [Vibrio parahaemolyticus]
MRSALESVLVVVLPSNPTPKKGGHGGKFTWIGNGYENVEMEHGAMDAKDPNFEDPAEIAAV